MFDWLIIFQILMSAVSMIIGNADNIIIPTVSGIDLITCVKKNTVRDYCQNPTLTQSDLKQLKVTRVEVRLYPVNKPHFKTQL